MQIDNWDLAAAAVHVRGRVAAHVLALAGFLR
jgi:hypothetical protein